MLMVSLCFGGSREGLCPNSHFSELVLWWQLGCAGGKGTREAPAAPEWGDPAANTPQRAVSWQGGAGWHCHLLISSNTSPPGISDRAWQEGNISFLPPALSSEAEPWKPWVGKAVMDLLPGNPLSPSR